MNYVDEFGTLQMNGIKNNTYQISTHQTLTLMFSTLEVLCVQYDILRKNNKNPAFQLKKQDRYLPTSKAERLQSISISILEAGRYVSSLNYKMMIPMTRY